MEKQLPKQMWLLEVSGGMQSQILFAISSVFLFLAGFVAGVIHKLSVVGEGGTNAADYKLTPPGGGK